MNHSLNQMEKLVFSIPQHGIDLQYYLQCSLTDCLFPETEALPLASAGVTEAAGFGALGVHPGLSSLNTLFLSDIVGQG